MNRILAFLMAACFCFSAAFIPVTAGGDGNYERWGFDGSDDSVWSFIDADGDGHGFEVKEFTDNYYALNSKSFDSNDGALLPDNYAVSPEVELVDYEAELYLHWLVAAEANQWSEEHYSLYVYTGTETLTANNVDELLADPEFSETLPTKSNIFFGRSIDLSAYMGQKVRFVFRHHDCTNQYSLFIDSISITNSHLIPHVHQWDVTYAGNETHHWYNCTVDGCPNLAISDNYGYGEHVYEYEYNEIQHCLKCAVCDKYDFGTIDSHDYTATVNGDKTKFICDVCGAEYEYLTDTLIEIPILLDCSEMAGSKVPVVINEISGTDKLSAVSMWKDAGGNPVTEFTDGGIYYFQLELIANIGYIFPLTCDMDSVQLLGIDWESTSYNFSFFNSTYYFFGEIMYSAESGIPADVVEESGEETSEVLSTDASEDSSEDVSEDTSEEALGDTGDVNGDGNVDSLDAAQILKYDAGIIDSITNADVNGDGVVNSLDAAMILKYDAGLIELD